MLADERVDASGEPDAERKVAARKEELTTATIEASASNDKVKLAPRTSTSPANAMEAAQSTASALPMRNLFLAKTGVPPW